MAVNALQDLCRLCWKTAAYNASALRTLSIKNPVEQLGVFKHPHCMRMRADTVTLWTYKRLLNDARRSKQRVNVTTFRSISALYQLYKFLAE